MEIKEILTRPSPAVYTVEELQFAIEQYILKKKNQNVTIDIFKGMPDVLNQNEIMHMHLQHQMLLSAFNDVQTNYYK